MIVNEGGKKLPKLTNPGASADLLTGKQLIDQYGNVVEGGMPIAEKEAPTFLTIYLATRGQITATAGYQVGYYERGGGFSATHTLSSEDDPDFIPENIRSGKNIFGVAGTYTGDYTRGYITGVSRVASNQLRFYTNIALKSKILGSVSLNDYNQTGYTYVFVFSIRDFSSNNFADQFAQFSRFPVGDDNIILYGIDSHNVDIGSNYFTILFTNPKDIYFSPSIGFLSDSETYNDGHNGRAIITYD